MRLRISILLILLSFINLGCMSFVKNQSFFYIEDYVKKQSTFVMNCVKLSYVTDNEVNDEIKKINSILKNYTCIVNNETNMRTLSFSNKDSKCQVNLWYESEKLHGQIVFENTNQYYTTEKLMKFINKIVDSKTSIFNSYYCYKGKINRSIINKFTENRQFKNIEVININNGFTGTADYRSEKINFAEVSYDTGSYIIIASPIIFTTY